MKNSEPAVRLINTVDYMVSVDLCQTYYSVKTAEGLQKYLCFEYRGKIHHFTYFANEISEGPQLFT